MHWTCKYNLYKVHSSINPSIIPQASKELLLHPQLLIALPPFFLRRATPPRRSRSASRRREREASVGRNDDRGGLVSSSKLHTSLPEMWVEDGWGTSEPYFSKRMQKGWPMHVYIHSLFVEAFFQGSLIPKTCRNGWNGLDSDGFGLMASQQREHRRNWWHFLFGDVCKRMDF